ncbi:hypothetical protein Adi01nite_32620 [Amorphoplanes digitatis]|uniref:Uncharacterized protein n=1 Tax=Actinoplanes digitatis TaxID=1868 RepID=A0A7W7MRW6_9ACTN|nr:hypothetical protein [Actinoplanes digitatis]GID93850.1 hypothetical protein Adi01nite_32620 [Actinoplanes digitatis]
MITPFYGYTDIDLWLMYFGIALAMAAVDGPVDRVPAGVSERAAGAVVPLAVRIQA